MYNVADAVMQSNKISINTVSAVVGMCRCLITPGHFSASSFCQVVTVAQSRGLQLAHMVCVWSVTQASSLCVTVMGIV